MAGEEPEVRRKHHRSSENGADGESKRRKHRHHRHHHRHRSSKHDHESKIEEQDLEISSLPDENRLILEANSNSRPDDDKEEGEILDEEDYGGLAKKKEESDVESGEIKSLEDSGGLENRNPGVCDREGNSSGRAQEFELKEVPSLENDIGFKSPANRRGNSVDHLHEDSDGKGVKEICEEADNKKDSMAQLLVSSDKDYETGETDTDSIKFREKKGERKHRDRVSRRANGDISRRSRKRDTRTRRHSDSPLEGIEIGNGHRACETSIWTRHGRSRSPIYEEDVDRRKNRNLDENDGQELDSARHISRKSIEPTSNERNNFREWRKSMSPENMEDKYATVVHSPYHDKYHEGGHVRKRSQSRDNVRERSRDHVRERSRDHVRERSQPRNYLQDNSVYHREVDVKLYADRSVVEKHSDSRNKTRDETDLQRVGRHDREDRHGSRDWMRDRERERSRSYCRNGRGEERHRSRDTREDRESERERARERDRSERERDRSERERERERGERESHRNTFRDRNYDKDRFRDRARDRNREGERRDRDLNGYNRDSGRSQHSEQGHYFNRRSKHQTEVSSFTNEALEEVEDKLKRDEDEQEDYEEKVELKLAAQEEEDIDRIKEESRKRREAILEKYRRKHQEKQAEGHSEGSEIEEKDSLTNDNPAKQASTAKVSVGFAPEGQLSKNNDSDDYVGDTVFTVGKSPMQNASVPLERASGAGGLGDGTPKSERSEDMFCDDIFGESPAGIRKTGKGEGLQLERNGLNDNWDDAEGYYSYRFGEVLDGRYEVIAAHGKGVFSTVVRVKDLKAGKGEPEEVAIKIIRNNDTMYKAGLEELIILNKLVGADPEDRRHCVRFISSFKYRNHLCLVFESLHMNLREVLKKFGRNIGLKLTAVRAYAKQLFISLKHLRNCGVLHCDIKPDNMLVNEAKTVLKLCDFGNAMFAGKNEITPYLVSRFYRAPEIILGLAYDHPMDIWSVGCCLYELYSGKVLFPGPSNNDMLRLHMELKGPFPKKMLRKGGFTDQHFDHDLNFYATEEDPVTKKTVKRLLLNVKPKDISAIITGSPGEDPKMLANFKDLLEKIFVLDPEKRMTVSQALNHPFITGK